jgi:hypothetical protein
MKVMRALLLSADGSVLVRFYPTLLPIARRNGPLAASYR